MKLEGAVVVVTGGARGIGEALVAAFVREKAAAVIVYDRELAAASAVVTRYEGKGTALVAGAGDVSRLADIEALVATTEARFGHIDLFCSNAGVTVEGGVEVPDADWQRLWDVNVMAHVHAARAALPGMLRRGSGHFLNTASGAGILIAPGAAAYTATKHAAVGFAEWLAITHAHQGIKVSLLCPGPVDTRMLNDSLASGNSGMRKIAETSVVLDTSHAADTVIAGLKEDQFFIPTHTDTLGQIQKKWSDVGRWIKSMSRFLQSPPKA